MRSDNRGCQWWKGSLLLTHSAIVDSGAICSHVHIVIQGKTHTFPLKTRSRSEAVGSCWLVLALHVPQSDYFPPTDRFMGVHYMKKSVQLYGSLSTVDGVENTNRKLALLADCGHSGISGGQAAVILVVGWLSGFLLAIMPLHNHVRVTK